jgi:hypothetical protein
VEVALIDPEAPLDLTGLDPDDLDPERTGKAPRESLLEELGLQVRSNAAPSS